MNTLRTSLVGTMFTVLFLSSGCGVSATGPDAAYEVNPEGTQSAITIDPQLVGSLKSFHEQNCMNESASSCYDALQSDLLTPAQIQKLPSRPRTEYMNLDSEGRSAFKTTIDGKRIIIIENLTPEAYSVTFYTSAGDRIVEGWCTESSEFSWSN